MTPDDLEWANELAQRAHTDTDFPLLLCNKRLLAKVLDDYPRLRVEVEVLRKGLEEARSELEDRGLEAMEEYD